MIEPWQDCEHERKGTRFPLRTILAAISILVLSFSPATPAAVAVRQMEFFEQKIRPILTDQCYKCHSQGSEKIKGGLVLDSRDGVLRGGDSGPAIVPGDPEKSLLIKAVRYTDKDLQMPPNDKRLTSAQVTDLVDWVRMGAPDPRTAAAPHVYKVDWEQAKKHWAFQPVATPVVPSLPDPERWLQSDIDHFILKKLKENKLTPAPPADKVTLLRRATFDLTGLPPTPKELDAFVADTEATAFAKVVDRLLSSPRYGERWGRYWLDLSRYADTKGQVGGNRDNRYSFAYTYRDYVIRAFNEDLPYDQFLIQQIAADKLALGDDPRPLAALGFLTLGNRFGNQINDIIDDRIDIIGKSTLGLTLACARCHDHKFDPIPTQDYYSLHGIFNSCVEPPEGPLLASPTNALLMASFEKQLAAKQAALDQFRAAAVKKLKTDVIGKAGDYMLAVYEHKKSGTNKPLGAFLQSRGLLTQLAAPWERTLAAAARQRDPIFALWFEFVAADGPDFAAKARAISAALKAQPEIPRKYNAAVAKLFLIPPGTLTHAAARYSNIFTETDRQWDILETMYEAQKKTQPDKPAPAGLDDPAREQIRKFLLAKNSPMLLDDQRTDQLLRRDNKNRAALAALEKAVADVKQEHPGSPPRAHVLEDAPKPKDSAVFIRGNAASKGPVAPRRFLQILSPSERPVFNDGSGRLQLAKAIADSRNPLTARVLVNRIWLHHFGEGLVRNPDDFGSRSDPPTHPELLDYLASEFVRVGWSIKKLHRLIMLSSVYQQSSDGAAKYVQLDPENRWLWHFNRRRLDFEAFRDTILMIGGKLDLTMGGPSVRLDAEPYPRRRSVYGYIDRNNLPGMFVAFDFASPDMTTGRRETTTVPQQALFMMNSPLVVEQARDLVKRPDFKACPTEQRKVELLYNLIYQRVPNAAELVLAREFLRSSTILQTGNSAATAWRYGYGEYDPFTKKVKRFVPMQTFASELWLPEARRGDTKLVGAAISAWGGHGANQYGVIRRWIAPRDGFISITAPLAHRNRDGDGIDGKIVSSRFGLIGNWTAFRNQVEIKFPKLQVQQDDTIDFIVEPRTNPRGDVFYWAPAIQLAPGSKTASEEIRDWNAERDFVGDTAGRSMEGWEKFAQVLLETNELAFVN